MSYKILISGSAHDYSEYGTEEESKELIYDLGYNLVQQDQGYGLKVINGNGFGVGPSLYEGIAEATAFICTNFNSLTVNQLSDSI